jgi:hypothetical protein
MSLRADEMMDDKKGIMLLRIMFVFWVAGVSVLSVLSCSVGNDLLVSIKVTSSGFVVHGFAYFVGMLLCLIGFNMKSIYSVLRAGFLILLYSVVLEFVQVYLPRRTFNVYDIAANGAGILLFVLIWITVWASGRKSITETRRKGR